MSQHGSLSRLVLALMAVILTLGALDSPAHAADVGFVKIRLDGPNADFGSGSHFNGNPDFGQVRWDYTPTNGVIAVKARVKGTLYVDEFGQGCSRLKINFQDRSSNNLQSPTPVAFCGPGSDANAAANKLAVDVTSSPDPRIARVQLVVASGPTLASVVDEKATAALLAKVDVGTTINNGTADFGSPLHAGGTPLNPAGIALRLREDGRIGGSVDGTLFWDSTSAGCSHLIVQFRDINNVNLRTRTFDACGPNGGNALLASNQKAVSVTFNDVNIFRIRVRVGRVVNATFTGPVTSRTFSFG